MVTLRPPMGWNSWNTFGPDVNEKVIMDAADAMVETGLLDAGYDYLVIDDYWSLRERDENGKLVADPEKFPHGMKYVADYVHSKGLKFGMYSCAGNLTCGGFPGSFEHEFVDAETFAEWEVDFLKYDYCYHSDIIHGKYLYRRMGLALANCGRDILFSACSWGADNTHEWIRETGAGMWRSTGDIYDNFQSVISLTQQQENRFANGGINSFNDMDMLVVGMANKGNVATGGCTNVQYKTHFSVWALLASPLMIGCDITQMDEETRRILTNKELIKINQDPACRQVIKLPCNHYCYARFLDNGDIALGIFNFNDSEAWASVNLDHLGLAESTGKTLEMHNVWDDEVITVKNGTFSHSISAYDCVVYRCKVVDAKY